MTAYGIQTNKMQFVTEEVDLATKCGERGNKIRNKLRVDVCSKTCMES